jgi:hypothetical protein
MGGEHRCRFFSVDQRRRMKQKYSSEIIFLVASLQLSFALSCAPSTVYL